MSEDEAGAYLMLLKSAFPSATVLPMTAKAYALGLHDVTYAKAEAAFPEVLRTHTISTIPTVAEIRDAVETVDKRDRALPAGGAPGGRITRRTFREWNDERQDFVELAEPRPWGEERDSPFRRMARAEKMEFRPIAGTPAGGMKP